MQREKGLKADIVFLDDVVETMKSCRDPIRHAQKNLKEIMDKANQALDL